MSSRPMWNRHRDPGRLLQYVQTGTAASLLTDLPSRAGGRDGPAARVGIVFEQFGRVAIRYDDEPLGSAEGWQRIRSPSEVLEAPRRANCVDIAVTFAGACLDAGVHPLIVLVETATGERAHALVAVWLEQAWPGIGAHRAYRDLDHDDAQAWLRTVRRSLDAAGSWLPLDVAVLARLDSAAPGVSLVDAVASANTILRTNAWRIDAIVDVGRDYDLRGSLGEVPQVPSGITSHADEVAGLGGLRRNLLAGNLRYVPPSDPRAPTAPKRLLTTLQEASERDRGVLLVGAAGVGKTRTCFEVAHEAIADGWAVFHVAPGEPVVTAEQVYAAVLDARSERVLVVLDYLNDRPGIDFHALAHRQLPAARRAGITMVVLASCRPGWRSNPDRPVDIFFDDVALALDDAQAAATRDAILRSLAPTAIASVGLDRMRELCGMRPVIIMLIASEAEELAVEGALRHQISSIRPEDLLIWLRRRLERDQLMPVAPSSVFADDTGDPSLRLQACLAMLVASPQPDSALLACGGAIAGLPEGGAAALLERLQSMGWIVSLAGGLGPVHDLVTDQLAERMLLAHGGGAVRSDVVERVLDACLSRGRTIGRYAANLSRVIRDLPNASATPLAGSAERWLAGSAAAAGARLAETEDEGAYALGAVLDSVAWRDTAFEAWEAIVGPWLDAHAQSPAARHLLYKGLRARDERIVPRLVREALAWLETNASSREASFVLAALLAVELDAVARGAVVDRAVAWLALHGEAVEAEFVLAASLGVELDAVARGAVVDRAVAWLALHGEAVEAQFVLAASLKVELDAVARGAVVDRAVAWLALHGESVVASFVLAALLGVELDLDAVARGAVVDRAVAWLALHGESVEAQFVLAALLKVELDAVARGAVVDRAVAWLALHGEAVVASFVLAALLGVELDAVARGAVVDRAVAWLALHGESVEAQFVLTALLKVELDAVARGAVVDRAVAWLALHGEAVVASFVLAALLKVELDAVARSVAVGHALAWLELHGADVAGADDAQYVLGPLVSLSLSNAERAVVDRRVNAWIQVKGVGSDIVSKYVSRRRDLDEPLAELLLGWAAKHPDDVDVAWRLRGVVKGFDQWQHLALRLARVVDAVLDAVDEGSASLNAHGELDSLLNVMCRREAFRSGSAGGWLDDILRRWVSRPEAFRIPTPPGSDFSPLVSRVCSCLMATGADLDVTHALDRIASWVTRWEPGRQRPPALDMIERYRRIILDA